MILLVLIALSLGIPSSSVLLKNATNLSQEIHKKCDKLIPQNTTAHDSLAALICGVNLPASPLQTDLSRSSLIHAYVVSGSHLVLLDYFCSSLAIPGILRFLILLLYSLAVGWQAPVVRALVAWILSLGVKHFRISWPSDLRVAVSGLLCLLLFSTWWKSISLILSWSAALALSSTAIWQVRRGLPQILVAQMSVFFCMCVPLFGWGSLHPLSIVFNLILGPLISLLLLPLAITALFLDPALRLFENIEGVFAWVLAQGAEPVVSHSTGMLPLTQLWSWLLFLHVLVHALRVRSRQKRNSIA